MRINKNLEFFADFDPTKKSSQYTVKSLCQKIEKNAITLPLYQRNLSWTLQKCVDLLNYQLLGKAPVSPISMNEINEKMDLVPQVSFIDRELVGSIERGQLSVVDGQQRLTTNYKAYSNHPDFRNIAIDLGKGCFVIVKDEFKPNQIPVGLLLNKEDKVLFDYTKGRSLKSLEISNLLVKIRNKLHGYNYTINMAEDLSEDEQIEWFEVLNNAGSRVSIIQMRFSKLKAHGIDIYTEYTLHYKNKLIEVGCDDYFSPQKTDVSYPIAALNPALELILGGKHNNNYAPISSDSKQDQLCNLSPEQLIQCFSITLEALDDALDFFEDNGLTMPKRIDYVNYLLGYIVFNGVPNKDEVESIINWIECTDFTNKSNTARREAYTKFISKEF